MEKQLEVDRLKMAEEQRRFLMHQETKADAFFFRLEEEKLALEKERLRVYFSSNSSRADSGDFSSSDNMWKDKTPIGESHI